MPISRHALKVLLGLALLPLNLPVSAQTVEAGMGVGFNKRFTARAGYLWSDADTSVRVDGRAGRVGAQVNLEDDLGMQKSKGLSVVELSWRLNQHHRFDFEYNSLSRDGRRTLTADIEFGDEIFTVGADVYSHFESDIWRLSWAWSLVNTGKVEFGTLLGLHVTEVSVGLRALGGQVEEAEDTTVPLPTIGLQGAYAFTPKLYLRGWFQWFTLEYGKYDGSLLNANLALDYYAFDNVGLGVGYAYYDYDLEIDDDHNVVYDYRFQGPMAYLNVYF